MEKGLKFVLTLWHIDTIETCVNKKWNIKSVTNDNAFIHVCIYIY